MIVPVDVVGVHVYSGTPEVRRFTPGFSTKKDFSVMFVPREVLTLVS